MKMFTLCVCLWLCSGLYAASFRDGFVFPRPAVPLNQALSKTPPLGTFYTFCNKSLDPLVIQYMSITPEVIKPGSYNNFTAITQLTEGVTGGEIDIAVKFSFFFRYSKILDLCETMKSTSYHCPLKSGFYNFIETVKIPNEIPKGHVTGTIIVKDSGGKELACFNIDIQID